jgi:two-component system chemotaxis response regulator CheY
MPFDASSVSAAPEIMLPSSAIALAASSSKVRMVVPSILEAIQAGAKDFIVKPFQPERIMEAVQKAA